VAVDHYNKKPRLRCSNGAQMLTSDHVRADARPARGHPFGTVARTDFPSPHLFVEESDMPVDDRTRLNLHRKLESVLGREEADSLMAHLEPVTWNEVATKDDLNALGATLRAELRADFIEGMNRQIKWLVTFAAAWTSVLVTLVRFIP
jgi:hypothetical protein